MQAGGDVSTMSLTAAELRRIRARPDVTSYETKYHTDKLFKPWPITRLIAYKCLLRKWYETEYLDFLPEASDEQLRRLMWEERVKGTTRPRFFWEHMISHTQGATCRHIVRTTFDLSVRMLRKYNQLLQEMPDDELGVNTAIAQWIEKHRLSYTSRNFAQIVNMSAVAIADSVPTDLQELLLERRAAGERPGKGLLDRTPEEGAAAQHQIIDDDITGSAGAGAGAAAAPPPPS